MGEVHGSLCISIIARIRRTLIKRHDDVSTDNALGIYGRLWRKKVIGTVNMRLKAHTFLCNFPSVRQRIDLKSTAIRQNGLVPSDEFVQSTCQLKGFQTWTQIKVVGITQNNLCLYIRLQLVLMDCFYGSNGSYWHENRCFNRAVVGGNTAGSSVGLGICML